MFQTRGDGHSGVRNTLMNAPQDFTRAMPMGAFGGMVEERKLHEVERQVLIAPEAPSSFDQGGQHVFHCQSKRSEDRL